MLADRQARQSSGTSHPYRLRSNEVGCRENLKDILRCFESRADVVVSGVRRMNEVNPRRARLVLGWVTVFGRVYCLGM